MTALHPFAMRAQSPQDNVRIALHIIQQRILAAESCLDPERMFGPSALGYADMEHAAHLLAEAVIVMDDLGWTA